MINSFLQLKSFKVGSFLVSGRNPRITHKNTHDGMALRSANIDLEVVNAVIHSKTTNGATDLKTSR